MFNYRETQTDAESLDRYANLLATCFPQTTHLTSSYLGWLYRDNPSGRVVGMDAVVEGRLAAHYVCIPVDVSLNGLKTRSLLSLNTVTHPEFQGQGLFTNLARLTYKLGQARGFSSVHGVANASSTPGFLRKLNFQLVAKLEARLGFGRPDEIDWEKLENSAQFRCLWNSDKLRWRIQNPTNPTDAVRLRKGGTAVYARTGKAGIVVWGETPATLDAYEAARPVTLRPRLFLGLYPLGTVRRKQSFSIPTSFRPSPLNFIFKSLVDERTLNPALVSFNFMDFDAY